MFYVKHWVEAVLAWLGKGLDESQTGRLYRFAGWLVEEAIPGGGLGPNETPRVHERHIADSLTFWAGFEVDPATVLDIGSGVGLPGIPLAIAMPSTAFTLLDRSQRRTDLASRAVRVLGLDNVTVLAEEVGVHRGRYDGVVMRAVLPPAAAVGVSIGLLGPGPKGTAVIGAGAEAGIDIAPVAGWGLDRIEVPVLDSPRTLLRITPR